MWRERGPDPQNHLYAVTLKCPEPLHPAGCALLLTNFYFLHSRLGHAQRVPGDASAQTDHHVRLHRQRADGRGGPGVGALSLVGARAGRTTHQGHSAELCGRGAQPTGGRHGEAAGPASGDLLRPGRGAGGPGEEDHYRVPRGAAREDRLRVTLQQH